MAQQDEQQREQQGFQQAANILAWASQDAGGDAAKEMQNINLAMSQGRVTGAAGNKILLGRVAQLDAPARTEANRRRIGAFGDLALGPGGIFGGSSGSPAAAPVIPTAPESPDMTAFMQQPEGPPPAPTMRPTGPPSAGASGSVTYYEDAVEKLRTLGVPREDVDTVLTPYNLPRRNAIPFAVAQQGALQRNTEDVTARNWPAALGRQGETARQHIDLTQQGKLSPQGRQVADLESAQAATRAGATAGASATASEQARAAFAGSPEGMALAEIERRRAWERGRDAGLLGIDTEKNKQADPELQASILANEKRRAEMMAQIRRDEKAGEPKPFSQLEADRNLKPVRTAELAFGFTATMRASIKSLAERELLPTDTTAAANWIAQGRRWWNKNDPELVALKNTALPYFIGMVDRGLADEKGARAFKIFEEQAKLVSQMPTKEGFEKLLDMSEGMFLEKAQKQLRLHEATIGTPGGIHPAVIEEERLSLQELLAGRAMRGAEPGAPRLRSVPGMSAPFRVR
jgi:hypothetical protein